MGGSGSGCPFNRRLQSHGGQVKGMEVPKRRGRLVGGKSVLGDGCYLI